MSDEAMEACPAEDADADVIVPGSMFRDMHAAYTREREVEHEWKARAQAAEAQALAWQRRSEQFEENERRALARNDDLWVQVEAMRKAAEAVLDAERRMDIQAMDRAMEKLAAALASSTPESSARPSREVVSGEIAQAVNTVLAGIGRATRLTAEHEGCLYYAGRILELFPTPAEARAVYLTGEAADAYRAWLEAERVKVQRIDEYNDRLNVVNAARRDGDWSAKIDFEYRRMTDACAGANIAHERLRVAALALPTPPKAEADHG